MRTIKIFLLALCFGISFSCEDVIDVPLTTSTPKIVIDASIRWVKGTNGAEQVIRISKSGDFYANPNDIPKVSGAQVRIFSSDPNVFFDFVETVQGTGEYVCNNFVPVLEESYTLRVEVEGQTFIAQEKLKKCPVITRIEQEDNVGFDGDTKSFKFFFQDDPNEENYYLESYLFQETPRPSFGVVDDEFTNGNEMFILAFKKIDAGKSIFAALEAVSKPYANYVDKIAALAGGQTNGPFATPPGIIRGNIVNQTNENDFPLGYFRLSEIDVRNYTVQ